jgi:hypothetical protein
MENFATEETNDFDCYQVERTSFRAGVASAVVQRPSRCTISPTTLGETIIAFSFEAQGAADREL